MKPFKTERTKGGKMKRALILSLMLGTAVVALPAVEARAATVNAVTTPQVITVRQQRAGWRRGRRGRTVTTTRITRVGPIRYRETIRMTYLPNGRTRTTIIRRERIGGRYTRNY
jgi:hypothetical protein